MMNTTCKNADNGWILCPSKRFLGKFYYFNVATGETAWSLNEIETKGSKSLSTQKADNGHTYPEPTSPPYEEIRPTTSSLSVQFTPIHENTYHRPFPTNYNPEIMSNSQINNGSNMSAIALNQLSHDCYWDRGMLPYPLQMPMSWPNRDTPQVIMFMMHPNSMRRQLPIENVRERKAPDHEILVHTGRTPLSQRFTDYRNSVMEFNQKIEQPKQNIETVFHEPSASTIPGPSNARNNNQRKILIKKPVFNITRNVGEASDSKQNIVMKKPENTPTQTFNRSNKSNVVFGAKNWQTHSQNNFIPNGPIKKQNPSNKIFGQSQSNQICLRQSQGDQGIVDKNQTHQSVFGQRLHNEEVPLERSQIYQDYNIQSQTYQDYNTQSQTYQDYNIQSQTYQDDYNTQSQINQKQFDQSLTNQMMFERHQTAKNMFGCDQNVSAIKKRKNQTQTDQDFIEQNQSNQNVRQAQLNNISFGQTTPIITGQNQTFTKFFGHIEENNNPIYQQTNKQTLKIQDCLEQNQSNLKLSKSQSNKELFQQSQSSERMFEGRRLFRQGQKYQEPFKCNQTEQNLEQSQTRQRLFLHKQSQSYQDPTDENQNDQNNFEQSQTSRNLFKQSQPDQKYVTQNQILISPRRTSQEEVFQFPNTIQEINNNEINIQKNEKSYVKSPTDERNQRTLITFDQTQALQNKIQNTGLKLKVLKKPITEKPTQKTSSKVKIQKTLSNLEVPSCFKNLLTNASEREKSTLVFGNKVQIKSSEAELCNLDEHDLRRMLLAKRKIPIDSSNDLEVGTTEKETTFKKIAKPVTPKKKVRFNLALEDVSDVTNVDDYSDGETTNKKAEEDLENIDLPSYDKTWYVVTDTKTLIEDLDLLEGFVKLDPKCNLVIPARVMSDVTTLATGDAERHYVTLARRSLRTLGTQQTHITVQPCYEGSSSGISTNESIINCCLEIIENTHVILITNDEELRCKAELLEIKCLNADQIKIVQANRPKIQFDIKKAHIPIANGDESKYISLEKNTRDKITICQKRFNSNFANVNENRKPELENNLNDNCQNSNSIDNSVTLQIQNDAINIRKCNTTLEENVYVTNSNEDISRKIDNDRQEWENRDDRIASIFKQANKSSFEDNGEGKKQIKIGKSIFNPLTGRKNQPSERNETETGIDEKYNTKHSVLKTTQQSIVGNSNKKYGDKDTRKIEGSRSQINTSIFDTKSSIFDKEMSRCQTKSIFDTESEQSQNNPSMFDTKSYRSQNKPSIIDTKGYRSQTNPSIFDTKSYRSRTKTSIFDTDSDRSQNGSVSDTKAFLDLDEFLKDFCERYGNSLRFIELRKEELVCSFRQVMEECLSYVLRDKSDLARKLLSITPPYSFDEALQVIESIYEHGNIRRLVSFLTRVSDVKGDISTSDVLTIFGCGIALIKHLKTVSDVKEHLREAQEALISTLELAKLPLADIMMNPVKAPTPHDESEELRRANVIKDRSEVLEYLRKHYPSWADYNEAVDTSVPNTTWGKSLNALIVRTRGRNLNKLKLTNPMTMTENDTFMPAEIKKSDQNHLENVDNNLNDEDQEDFNWQSNSKENNNVTENNVSKITETKSTFSLHENANKKYEGLKLVRKVKNTPNHVRKSDENNDNIDLNDQTSKQKVVRIFTNYNFTKNTTVNTSASGISDFDEISAYGHTFGIDDKKGPRVLRQIKLIKEFEDKYNTISKKIKNDPANETTDALDYEVDLPECLAINSLDGENDITDGINVITGRMNDITDGINDSSDTTNDTKFTNNRSQSMSLDDCIANNIQSAFKISNNGKNINTTNDMNINSASFSGIDDELKTLNLQAPDATNDNVEMSDVKNDIIVQKHDSDCQNESLRSFRLKFLLTVNETLSKTHKFILESMNYLRAPSLCEHRNLNIHDTALMARNLLTQIIKTFDRIIDREVFMRPRVKDLVEDDDSIVKTDGPTESYAQIARRFQTHANIINKTLQTIINWTEIRKKQLDLVQV